MTEREPLPQVGIYVACVNGKWVAGVHRVHTTDDSLAMRDGPPTTTEHEQPPGLAERVLACLRERGLNQRQAEILLLDAQGYTTKKIAAQLCLSERTVDWYWQETRGILGLPCRNDGRAVVWQILEEITAGAKPLLVGTPQGQPL